MHGRTHGWRSIEGVAIAHDVNHLTVLSWDQMQPFMNDTFDWPQWPALDVSHSGVIEYFQSMVVLGDPEGDNMEFTPIPTEPPANDPTDSPNDPVDPPMTDPVTPPTGDHEGHDHSSHDGVSQLQLVAATTAVSLLTDSATGLAYVQDAEGEPILITRADDYWEGDVPLRRGDATLQAAARDELGRLRVLDGGGLDVYAWILSETGHFIGEEGPTDSSIGAKESLFQLDIDDDGQVGQPANTAPTDPTASPADPVDSPTEDHHEDHNHSSHDSIAPPAPSGDYVDITSWGTFHGSNNNSHHDELVGGRTAITTEAMPRPTTTCGHSSVSRP